MTITHNLMILWRVILFYRAVLTPFLFNSISYCRFKYINVYILYSFKPDAISGHTRLA